MRIIKAKIKRQESITNKVEKRTILPQNTIPVCFFMSAKEKIKP